MSSKPDTEIKTVNRFTVCPCNSGKVWGECCGSLLESKSGILVSSKLEDYSASAYYFVFDIINGVPYRDSDSLIPVFSTLAQANRLAEQNCNNGSVVVVIGVSADKFDTQFKPQVGEQYYMVPSSTVSA